MSSAAEAADSNHKLLELVLKPVVHLCLRHGFSFQSFLTIAKRVFVTAAAEEIERSGKKVNTSRLSALTGIYRMEIDRILERGEDPPSESVAGLIPRVVTIWERAERYTTSNGAPRVLTCTGDKNEFRELVAEVSQHLNAGTVLFELERSGMVEKTPRGVRLVRRLMRLGGDRIKAFDLLSRDIDSLIAASEENVLIDKPISNLHIRTEYDNVYRSAVPIIRRWLVDEGKAFHRRAREFLSQYDKDVAKDQLGGGEAGVRVVVSAFSFTNWFPENIETLPPPRQQD